VTPLCLEPSSLFPTFFQLLCILCCEGCQVALPMSRSTMHRCIEYPASPAFASSLRLASLSYFLLSVAWRVARPVRRLMVSVRIWESGCRIRRTMLNAEQRWTFNVQPWIDIVQDRIEYRLSGAGLDTSQLPRLFLIHGDWSLKMRCLLNERLVVASVSNKE
jgi:hypothetical protein